MTDIVERLNKAPWREVCEHGSQRCKCPICELADAEKEIERLRAALRRILDSVAVTASGVEICQCSDFDSARDALDGK